jgi:hypothetical protein
MEAPRLREVPRRFELVLPADSFRQARHGDVRPGLHTGECEVADGKVADIAVHTGARVAAQADGDEVLASSTVKDLIAGLGIAFIERGVHELKGIPGEWRCSPSIEGRYSYRILILLSRSRGTMAAVRRILRHRIAIAGAAVVFAAGGGAAYAASQSSSNPREGFINEGVHQ